MSYALKVMGLDKDRLKVAVLNQVQCEGRRYGIPPHVVERVHEMIDEIVLLAGHAIEVDLSGHSGPHSVNESLRVGLIQVAG